MDINKNTKFGEENIKRDDNLEDNWRIKSNGNRPRSESYGSSTYRNNIDKNWRIKTSENLEGDIGRAVDSRRRHRDSYHRQSLSQEELLPSQVVSEEYLYFPSNPEAIDNMKRASAGKWLVYGDFSMTNHDETWAKLLPLCKEGILIGLKASTSIITDAQQYMGGEVILCYTADAYDVNDVKKAGDAIRRAIGYSNAILYYKTNAASVEGLYAIEGCKAVTKYSLSSEGTFCTRDKYRRWILTNV